MQLVLSSLFLSVLHLNVVSHLGFGGSGGAWLQFQAKPITLARIEYEKRFIGGITSVLIYRGFTPGIFFR